MIIKRLVFVCLAFLSAVFALIGTAQAHPADELCGIGSGLDPELCEALYEVDAERKLDALAALQADRQGEPSTEELLERMDRTLLENTGYFIVNGVRHILPGGTDHILFVLALFFAVRRFRPLALQISLFTLAHSVTLGFAAAGLVNVSPDIVEPLIALSIGLVAVENIFFRQATRWRPLIVFAFGLFHGLGFAGFFLEQDLPEGLFWSSLIGFNIGVEIGQISVVLIAYLLLRWFFRTNWYTNVIATPASILIALIGFWWAFERTFL